MKLVTNTMRFFFSEWRPKGELRALKYVLRVQVRRGTPSLEEVRRLLDSLRVLMSALQRGYVELEDLKPEITQYKKLLWWLREKVIVGVRVGKFCWQDIEVPNQLFFSARLLSWEAFLDYLSIDPSDARRAWQLAAKRYPVV